MSNVSKFPGLVARARNSLLAHLRLIKDETVTQSLRMALLWVNTAGDAERVGDLEAAKRHLGNAMVHLGIASHAHKMHLVHPLTALTGR